MRDEGDWAQVKQAEGTKLLPSMLEMATWVALFGVGGSHKNGEKGWMYLWNARHLG